MGDQFGTLRYHLKKDDSVPNNNALLEHTKESTTLRLEQEMYDAKVLSIHNIEINVCPQSHAKTHSISDMLPLGWCKIFHCLKPQSSGFFGILPKLVLQQEQTLSMENLIL